MGLELVILYAVYAVCGTVALSTIVGATTEIISVSKTTNADKYVACQQNSKNDAESCKGLE